MEGFNEAQFRLRWRVEQIGPKWAVLRRKLLKAGVVVIARPFDTRQEAEKYYERQYRSARTRYFHRLAKQHFKPDRREATLWEGPSNEQDSYSAN